MHSFEETLRAVCRDIKPKRILEWGPGKSTSVMREECPDAQIISTEHNEAYAKIARETYLECLRLGLPTLNYNTHFPVPIHKRAYVEALGRVPLDTESGDGILCRSIYGNSVGGGEFCIDAKESAREAIAALDVAFVSLPNGSKALYPFLEAATS